MNTYILRNSAISPFFIRFFATCALVILSLAFFHCQTPDEGGESTVNHHDLTTNTMSTTPDTTPTVLEIVPTKETETTEVVATETTEIGNKDELSETEPFVPAPSVNTSPTSEPVGEETEKPQLTEAERPTEEPLPTTKGEDIVARESVEPKPVKPAAPVVSSTAFSLKTTRAVVKGTSTLHDWESQVATVEGKGQFHLKDDVLTSVENVEIKIPVKGIISTEGKKMDNKTYETFKSDTNPFIVYNFSHAEVKIDASNSVSIESSGNLKMAGTSKPVRLKATGKVLSNGDLQLSVSKQIKMTDYNMEPPVMMLGTLKVGDEVAVSFDFILEKAKNFD